MDTRSDVKTKWLATTSLILGILSFGLLLLTFLFLVWIKFSDYDEFRKLALLGWAVILFLSSLTLGIPGCIIAIIALRRNRAEGGDSGIKRIALTGVVLNGVVVAIVFIFIAFVFFFNPSNPSPVPVTPSPLIPAPNGG